MEKQKIPKKLTINKELIEKLSASDDQFYGGDGGYNTFVVQESAICSGVCQSSVCSSSFCGSFIACGTYICAGDGCGNNNCYTFTYKT